MKLQEIVGFSIIICNKVKDKNTEQYFIFNFKAS